MHLRRCRTLCTIWPVGCNRLHYRGVLFSIILSNIIPSALFEVYEYQLRDLLFYISYIWLSPFSHFVSLTPRIAVENHFSLLSF